MLPKKSCLGEAGRTEVKCSAIIPCTPNLWISREPISDATQRTFHPLMNRKKPERMNRLITTGLLKRVGRDKMHP
jgi:hypothetical protein